MLKRPSGQLESYSILTAREGTVFVIEDADELKILTETEFVEEFYAAPAFVEGTLYLRSDRALWAFRQGDAGQVR